MIGIVTVSWKGFAITLELVKQLLAGDFEDFRLVVVNNSPEEAGLFESCPTIQEPRITVIHSPGNVGYSGGLNAGLRALLPEPRISHFLLMNNDVKIEADFIRRLIAQGSRPDRMYAPLILLRDTGLVQNSGGDIHLWLGGTTNLNKNVPVEKVRRRQPGFLGGCVLFVPRPVIEKVGLFDEAFGSYFEDVDYCVRAQAAGIPGEVLWDVHARHDHSYSTQGINSYKIFLLNRNQIYYARKHLPHIPRLVFVTAAVLRGFLSNLSRARFGPYLRGVREGFRGRPGGTESLPSSARAGGTGSSGEGGDGMKKISIVIPVLNEAYFIGGLLKSIEEVRYPPEDFEVIVVNDGSTDRTAEIVRSFPKVRLIDLPTNIGRYQARRKGAEAARFPNVLFVDSRSVVDPGILEALDRTDAKAVNGYVGGIEKPGGFETFYRAVRRIAFHQFYTRFWNQPLWLTAENFETMPKGTTVFYAEKDVLFRAYADLAHDDMGIVANDDTKLFKEIIKYTPILIHPDVKITNFYRSSFRRSLYHLGERGVKFTDYYLNPALEKFWLVIFFPLLGLAAILAWLLFAPPALWIKAAALLGLNLLVTLLLSRSVRDFFIILYMAPLCTLVFYAGVVLGIFRKLYRSLKRPARPGGSQWNVFQQALSLLRFKSSERYWIDRYQAGGSSGSGSYGQLAAYKAAVINRFIEENGIQSVVEFGCGDGVQLGLICCPSYTGYDVSPEAVAACRDTYRADATRQFGLMKDYQGQTADLALSLDVIYHLVEDDVFDRYMRTLFQAAEKYILIYSTDTADHEQPAVRRFTGPHIRHRPFTRWVSEHMPNWKLVEHLAAPDLPGFLKPSRAEFYIYQKVC